MRKYSSTVRGSLLLAKLANRGVLQETRGAMSVCKNLAMIDKVLQRLAVRECNGTLTEAQECQQSELEKSAEVLARKLGAHAVISRDPRGAVLKLQFPGDPGDSFGGDGYVIDD